MNTLYIPIVKVPEPLFPEHFGVQIEGKVSDYMQFVVPNRLYQWPIRWDIFENDKILYDANHLSLIEHNQIITIKGCPKRYRLWPEFVGSPPHYRYYPKLAEFIQAVINRYKPVAIELYNEPDCRVKDAFAPEFFGAWVGNDETFFQGGMRYGEMCNEVGQMVKGTKILVGALMMNEFTHDFLHGMVETEFEESAQALSFHCYIRTKSGFEKMSNITEQFRMITTLPFVCTETSLLGNGSSTHEKLKADYMIYLKNNFGYLGVESLNWYAFNSGWENADLTKNKCALPVWEIWKC